jgi:hypothetical protein
MFDGFITAAGWRAGANHAGIQEEEETKEDEEEEILLLSWKIAKIRPGHRDLSSARRDLQHKFTPALAVRTVFFTQTDRKDPRGRSDSPGGNDVLCSLGASPFVFTMTQTQFR